MKPIGGEIAIKDQGETSFITDSGRSSLRLLLRSGKFRSMKFLIPNFFCSVIEEVLIEEKVNYSFYDINEDLSINNETINAVNYDVLYVINYFGKISDLSSIDLSNKILVEDNVFLYNFENYQNSENWYAFNSYRKFSPLTDGSLIKTNLRINPSEINNIQAPFSSIKRDACKKKYAFISENKSSEIEFLQLFNSGEKEINNQNDIYCISPQSLNLIFKGDFNNQEILKSRFVELQDLTQKESELPSYFSFFSFVLRNKKGFLEFMKRNNIFLPNFWPETTQKNDLYTNLVVIPLFYNDIEFKYVKEMLKTFLDNNV
tara:strand:+ start:1179 stop:2129 length:951 start_codon:yes stop_codon:yes gene_type:complete